MANVLVIAEHDGSNLNPSTAKCVACAAEIDGASIDVAVFGESIDDVAVGVSPRSTRCNRVLTVSIRRRTSCAARRGAGAAGRRSR